MKILISDCFSRKAFDVYNIVKKNYGKSSIILASSSRCGIKERIIYFKKVYYLSTKSQEKFNFNLENILNIFHNESIVYLPIDENINNFLINFSSTSNVSNLKFLLPNNTSFSISRDKLLLNQFCNNFNIPAPVCFNASPIRNDGKFIPLIIKPRIGTGSKGIIHINCEEDYRHFDKSKLNDNYVIQEKIPNGKDVKGAFFLCNNGTVLSSYCHERIVTFPKEGGVTVISKTVMIEEIIKTGSELLKMLNWSGFAMIEFLWDQKNLVYKVIEINPRLWGSILLSEFANTSFIDNYIKICLNQNPVSSSVKINTYIKWPMFNILSYNPSLKIEDSKDNTCYINFTYATKWSSFMFHLLFYTDYKNFKTLIEKCKK